MTDYEKLEIKKEIIDDLIDYLDLPYGSLKYYYLPKLKEKYERELKQYYKDPEGFI